jgi:hypothetical protein
MSELNGKRDTHGTRAGRGEAGGGGGGDLERHMNSNDMNSSKQMHHSLGTTKVMDRAQGVSEIEADVLELSIALDRLGLAERAGAPEGLEARVAAASAAEFSTARASSRGVTHERNLAMAPASIPFRAARDSVSAAAGRRGAAGNSSGWLSPLRLAAGLALAAAVLGAVLAQRPTGVSGGSGTSVANSDGSARGAASGAAGAGDSSSIALAGLTLADVALGEEILDVIAPLEFADSAASGPEGSGSAEFWSFDALSEESL